MTRLLLAATASLSLALPAAAQPPVEVVFFADWSGALDDAAQTVIQHAASTAKQNPGAPITVTGYADNTGSEQANLYLTQLRAQRVVDTLTADGVDPARLKMVAAGEQRQRGVASRRAEIVFGP